MKRILAIIAIILLLALYVASLVLAIAGSPYAFDTFMTTVMMTVFIPILIWIYTTMYKNIKDRKQSASMMGKKNDEEQDSSDKK